MMNDESFEYFFHGPKDLSFATNQNVYVDYSKLEPDSAPDNFKKP